MIARTSRDGHLLLTVKDSSVLAMSAEFLVSTTEWKPAKPGKKVWYGLCMPFCRHGEEEDYREVAERLSPSGCRVLAALFRVAKLVYLRSNGRPQLRRRVLARYARLAKHETIAVAMNLLDWAYSNRSESRNALRW